MHFSSLFSNSINPVAKLLVTFVTVATKAQWVPKNHNSYGTKGVLLGRWGGGGLGGGGGGG